MHGDVVEIFEEMGVEFCVGQPRLVMTSPFEHVLEESDAVFLASAPTNTWKRQVVQREVLPGGLPML